MPIILTFKKNQILKSLTFYNPVYIRFQYFLCIFFNPLCHHQISCIILEHFMFHLNFLVIFLILKKSISFSFFHSLKFQIKKDFLVLSCLILKIVYFFCLVDLLHLSLALTIAWSPNHWISFFDIFWTIVSILVFIILFVSFHSASGSLLHL